MVPLCLVLLIGAEAAYAQLVPPPFPVTFQQAIRHALDNYPAIRASMARVAAQQAGVDLARTSYLPRLDYGFQINRATRNNIAGTLLPGPPIPSITGPVSDSISASSVWGSTSGLLLSWDAYDFGLRSATVGLAEVQVTRARAGAGLTQLDVGVRAADAFLQLAAARETVGAARANVERQDVFANSVAVLVEYQDISYTPALAK